MHTFWRIRGDVEVLENGNMYAVVDFWPNSAAFARGDAPSLISDFVSNANTLIGKPRSRKITRQSERGLEAQLETGEWVTREEWESNPRPIKRETLAPVSKQWADNDLVAQIRAWVRKVGDITGDQCDQRLVRTRKIGSYALVQKQIDETKVEYRGRRVVQSD